MMRTALVLPLISILFAGCVTVQEPTTTVAEKLTPEGAELIYLVSLEMTDIDKNLLAVASDDDLIEIGWGLCNQMRTIKSEGGSFDDWATWIILMSDGASQEELNTVARMAGVASFTLCPDMDGWNNQ